MPLEMNEHNLNCDDVPNSSVDETAAEDLDASSSMEIASDNSDSNYSCSYSEDDINDDLKVIQQEHIQKLQFLQQHLGQMYDQMTSAHKSYISEEILQELAFCLLDDAVQTIVKDLMVIQHATEAHLSSLRAEIIKMHQEQVKEITINTGDPIEFDRKLKALQQHHVLKLRETDMKIVWALDKKAAEQQSILQRAGVPCFFNTEHPNAIKRQMLILDLILRLSRKSFSIAQT